MGLQASVCCFPANAKLFRTHTSKTMFSCWCTYNFVMTSPRLLLQQIPGERPFHRQITYQTLLVRVSFCSAHGRVLKIASPLTWSHEPTSRRRSSNIGRITPSAVGPIFINKFPALTKHICINTSQSNREGIVTARKAVISREYLPPQLTVVTRVSINSWVVRKSSRRAFLLKAHAYLSIVMAFSHLRVCRTPFHPKNVHQVRHTLGFVYKSFERIILFFNVYLDYTCLDNSRNRHAYTPSHVPTDHSRLPYFGPDYHCKAKRGSSAYPSIFH